MLILHRGGRSFRVAEAQRSLAFSLGASDVRAKETDSRVAGGDADGFRNSVEIVTTKRKIRVVREGTIGKVISGLKQLF